MTLCSGLRAKRRPRHLRFYLPRRWRYSLINIRRRFGENPFVPFQFEVKEASGSPKTSLRIYQISRRHPTTTQSSTTLQFIRQSCRYFWQFPFPFAFQRLRTSCLFAWRRYAYCYFGRRLTLLTPREGGREGSYNKYGLKLNTAHRIPWTAWTCLAKYRADRRHFAYSHVVLYRQHTKSCWTLSFTL